MELEVFFSVIVGKLSTRMDGADGEDIDSTIADPSFAIWSAGVINEASDIRRNVSVDHGRGTCPEEILPAIVPHLFGCSGATKVLDDE